MQSAEELARQAMVVARRAETKAEGTANVMLDQGQALGRIEREVKQLRSDLVVGLRSVRDRLPPRETLDLSYEDFEETSNGSHYKVTKGTVEHILGSLATEKDARSWRTLWRRVRWAVWILLGGALTLGGEKLLSYVLLHL